MKYILYIIFSVILISISYGYYIKSDDELLGHKLIGIAVIGFFLVWMPLFMFHRYKNNDIKKYMITNETIKKIKDEAETFID
jgi:cytosine/uracil/thiamine/allantoin permease